MTDRPTALAKKRWHRIAYLSESRAISSCAFGNRQETSGGGPLHATDHSWIDRMEGLGGRVSAMLRSRPRSQRVT